MTLDEAIKHAEEAVDRCEDEASRYDMSDYYESHMACQAGKCAEEHRQLAEWLKELKRLREQTGWIPVSERLPEKSDRYLAYIVNRKDDKLQYIMTCDYLVDGYWNWFPDAESASDNVIAWMPLPAPFDPQESEVSNADSN